AASVVGGGEERKGAGGLLLSASAGSASRCAPYAPCGSARTRSRLHARLARSTRGRLLSHHSVRGAKSARAARNVMKRVGVFRHEVADFFPTTVGLLQHFNNFYRKPHCPADWLVFYSAHSTHRGLAMSIVGPTSTEQTTAIKAVFVVNDVRALVANHLGVSVGRVTDEAHFTDDLGADWLDRLDLMIAVEDQFAGVEITSDDVDR